MFIEDHELGEFKTKIKKQVYSSFDNYNFWKGLISAKKII